MKGKKIPKDIVDSSPDEIRTLMYTSGSTGLPKGTIMSDDLVNHEIAKKWGPYKPLVIIAYMPLAHGMQRNASIHCFANGGRMGIFNDVCECQS